MSSRLIRHGQNLSRLQIQRYARTSSASQLERGPVDIEPMPLSESHGFGMTIYVPHTGGSEMNDGGQMSSFHPSGQVVMSLEQLENMINAAAERAAKNMASVTMSREETVRVATEAARVAAEKAAEESSQKAFSLFMLRIGIDEDDLKNTRKDFSFMRAVREVMSAIGKHGMLSGAGVITLGILWAIWTAIQSKTGMPK